MNTALTAIVVAALTFTGGMVGLYLQTMLPEQHSVEKSRDMIGSVMGLVTLLLALVLGTIVGSAYFFRHPAVRVADAVGARSCCWTSRSRSMGPKPSPSATA